MSPARSSALDPREIQEADKYFANPDVDENLSKLQSKAERKSMQTQIKEATKAAKEFIKDPEKRKEAMVVLGAGLLLWLFKGDPELDEEIEGKEETEEATESEMEEMAGAGLVETVDENEKPKEPAKDEVMRNYQFIAIQIKAAMNSKNTKALNEKGITIPEAVQKLTSTSMFREGIGSYEDFINKLAATLQPDVKDPKKLTNNLAEILGRCALGKYQILPKFHFGKLGWSYEGEIGLRNMYEFLRSPGKQDQLNREIIIRLGERFKGNVRAMAAAYYSGDKGGYAMLKLSESGAEEIPEWLTRSQTMGGGTFGSIAHYSTTVGGYYKKDKVDIRDEGDIIAFQQALGKKETGFLAGRRAKAPTIEVA
jgi:hypothetical protein